VEDVERYRDVLLSRGWRYDVDLHYERIEGAEHNEAAGLGASVLSCGFCILPR
jgi:hypothetical protein